MRYPMAMYRQAGDACEICEALNEEQERGLVTFGFSMDPGHGGDEVVHVRRQYVDVIAEELGDPTPIEPTPEPVAVEQDAATVVDTEADATGGA